VYVRVRNSSAAIKQGMRACVYMSASTRAPEQSVSGA